MPSISVEGLWQRSIDAHRRGRARQARVLKALIFTLFHASLPFEVELGRSVHLWHKGLGTVIHPNTTIGDHVGIGQNVTIAADAPAPGGLSRVVLEDRVLVGAGAVILARAGGVLTIGEGAIIGANAIITKDVAAGLIMVGPTAVSLGRRADASERRISEQPGREQA